jgi:hypothetical protein
MRAWTIQTPEVLAALRAGRTWRAESGHVQQNWLSAYRWMARRMAERIGAPASTGQMPIWLWCQWRGIARARPDLRATGHLPPGTPGVRIDLEIDEARVLRSDFELWHYVLNGWFLPESLLAEQRFEAAPAAHRIEPSWQRIFALDWHNRRYTPARVERSIQATTWELRPQDVRGATRFIAR